MKVQDRDASKRVARLFRNGRSQAVRIPKEWEFDGDEVIVGKTEDGKLTIEAKKRRKSLIEVLRELEPLPDEDRMPEIEDFPPEPVDLDWDDRR